MYILTNTDKLNIATVDLTRALHRLLLEAKPKLGLGTAENLTDAQFDQLCRDLAQVIAQAALQRTGAINIGNIGRVLDAISLIHQAIHPSAPAAAKPCESGAPAASANPTPPAAAPGTAEALA